MRNLKQITAALSAAVLALTAVTAAMPAAAFDYAPVKSRVSVHDPSIIKADGTYYVFGSHIDAAKSTDLQNWKTFTNGYAAQNNVEFGNLSQNLAKAFAWAGEDLEDCKGGFAVWAPDVVWNPDYVNADGSKGAYLMYFCTSSTYKRSVIAYAAAQNVEGPYTFVDTLIYSGFTDNDSFATSNTKNVNRKYTSTNIDELIAAGQVEFNNGWFNKHDFNNQLYPNAIDPTIYFGTDGKMYMCYGSWSGGIFSLEIDRATGQCIHPKTGQTADGRMVDSYFGTKISGGYGKSGEGPFIEYNEDTGFYYLWVTYGGLTSEGGYNMRVGRSRDPLGPFTDAAGRDMVLESNSNLNSIGLKVMTNYQFSSLKTAYMACGHNSVLKDDDGQWYLFNHARFNDGTEYHEVRVHAMHFSDAGWPVVMPYEYSGETWSETGYNEEQLAGSYEFINHGTATDGTITKSAEIKLNPDHTISGAAEGTWSEAADSAKAEFQIGKVKYTGWFAAQHDESGTGKTIMTFTAAGTDNQTIWGVQTDAWSGSERSLLYNHIGSAQVVYDRTIHSSADGETYISGTKLLSDVPYHITNVNSGLFLETDPETGAVQQWASRGNKSGNANQDFRITDLGNGYCRLTSMVEEDQCIAVSSASAENGVELSLQLYTGEDNQQWKLVKNGGYYGIVSKCSADAAGLDVYEWSTKNGGAVKQWEFWGGECQLWKIEPTYGMVHEADFAFRNVGSGLVLGRNGNEIVQTNYLQNCAWTLKACEDGSGYCIVNGFLETVTMNPDGSFSLAEYAGDETQKFQVWCNADGSYSLLSAADEKSALSIKDASSEFGAAFVMEKFDGSASQRFVFVPTEGPIIDVIPMTTEPVITTTAPNETTTEPVTTTTEPITTITEPQRETTAPVTTTTEPATTKPQGKLVLGDVTLDGTVDVADAVLLCRLINEDPYAVIKEQGMRNGDCNQDGKRNDTDVLMILRHIAHLVPLPVIE